MWCQSMISKLAYPIFEHLIAPIIIPIALTRFTIYLKTKSYYKTQIPVLKSYNCNERFLKKENIFIRLDFEGESLEERCYEIDFKTIKENDVIFAFRKRNYTEDIFSIQTIVSKDNDVSITTNDDVIPKNEVLNEDVVFVISKRFMPLIVFGTYIEKKVKYIMTNTGNCIGKYMK